MQMTDLTQSEARFEAEFIPWVDDNAAYLKMKFIEDNLDLWDKFCMEKFLEAKIK
jgi:hypothetical protein